jgi:hypothetical protein
LRERARERGTKTPAHSAAINSKIQNSKVITPKNLVPSYLETG